MAAGSMLELIVPSLDVLLLSTRRVTVVIANRACCATCGDDGPDHERGFSARGMTSGGVARTGGEMTC